MLKAPARLDIRPDGPVIGGGFALWYAAGLGVVVAVGARIVADLERAGCAATSCAGRPAEYLTAVRWLLQRLLFSDPPGISPGTLRGTVLGWLISVAAAMFVVVLLVAAARRSPAPGRPITRTTRRSPK